ncbi:MAG: proline--tRNA ligase [Desulfovibrionaceae bacterium]|nr:proline--tRNA ligase [Desulfovibrionaceae bacterium]
MRFSSMYIPTLKETPAEAEVVSHKLLLRAGMIRKLTAGLYTYLPMGLRVLRKIASIVREEMDRAGFQEVLLPIVQPGDLWQETGRWEHYGKELLRFKDRNDRDYCLGPTHEEVMTDLVRGEVRSYRQLPLRLYQLHTKFRDEIRPRFGLMRGREFIMKDAYSYDADLKGAETSYQLMYEAYQRIFTRLGVQFRAVEADTGSIGGNFSHEFMVLAAAGEDTIAYCDHCSYAANVERAEVVHNAQIVHETCPAYVECPTPNMHTVHDIAKLLNVSETQVIKTMLLLVDAKPIAVLVRGDHEVNLVKVQHLLHANSVELAPAEVVEKVTQAPLGFAGPVHLQNVPIYADYALQGSTDYVTGANAKDLHLQHVDLERDVNITAYADVRNITSEDPCPRCGGKMMLTRGIEVGHIFMLGEKYSSPMQATFLNEAGTSSNMLMGCYGIGISRVMAACIEQLHDDQGIIFPPSIAPFTCVLLNLDASNPTVTEQVEQIYKILQDLGVEVLLDDRDERPGVKFKDADLLGIPLQLALGKKSLAKGIVECKARHGSKVELPLADFATAFQDYQKQVIDNWTASIKPAVG